MARSIDRAGWGDGMLRLRVAAVLIVAGLATPALAETAKPKNVLEWLFGSRGKEQAPTSITPPQPTRITAPAQRQSQSARPDGKADVTSPNKRSLRKTASKASQPVQSIDGAKQTVVASGPYSGPFRGGGNNAFCVRTCDGFFFPINFEGVQGSDRYETACQSSCPGAETQVFFMKRGGDIKWSSSARGVGYMSLPNALKYRKERDPACACKDQQQSWASVLAPVEGMIKSAKSDIVVTDEQKQASDAAAQPIDQKQQEAEGKKVEPAKQADLASDRKTSGINSTFSDKIAPANRFNRIDPQATGGVANSPRATAKPEIDPEPTGSISATPQAPKAKADPAFDKDSLNQAVSRLVSPYKRQQ